MPSVGFQAILYLDRHVSPPEEAKALTAGNSVCLKTWYCSSSFSPQERNNPDSITKALLFQL